MRPNRRRPVTLDRRDFLVRTGLLVGAGAL
ncbi:MAG: twin-arginine translocation signal domain-containing protein, partial [Gaiellaceae bacterium]